MEATKCIYFNVNIFFKQVIIIKHQCQLHDFDVQSRYNGNYRWLEVLASLLFFSYCTSTHNNIYYKE